MNYFPMRSLQVQDLWQTTIAGGVETGQTPSLDLGLSTEILANLDALLALLTFAADRQDLTAPQVIIGGASSSWLVALLALDQRAAPDHPPALTVTYGGADAATQLASVGIYQQPIFRPLARRELPPGYAPWFAPASVAAPRSWPAWPWLFVTAGATALRTAADRWLQWTGLALAVGLIVLALLV